jgi:hypothetical protein
VTIQRSRRPGEPQTIEQICEAFDTILQTTAKDYGHAVRSVHAKAHGILEGTLTIDINLPPGAKVCSQRQAHIECLRLSTNAGDILPDSISLPRGLAIKVLDVEGERLPNSEGATQDFVMVNGKVFQARLPTHFAEPQTTCQHDGSSRGTKKLLSAALRGVNSALEAVGIESPKIASLGGASNVDPLGETYYSVTPFRYGDFIAKFSVAPVSPHLTALTGSKSDAGDRPDAIRETLQIEKQNIDGVWEFRVQLARVDGAR